MLRLDQVGVPPNRVGKTLLTFWANIQLCSETKWANGDVGRDPQRYVSLGIFWLFLRFLLDRGVHPCSGEEDKRKWRTYSTKCSTRLGNCRNIAVDKTQDHHALKRHRGQWAISRHRLRRDPFEQVWGAETWVTYPDRFTAPQTGHPVSGGGPPLGVDTSMIILNNPTGDYESDGTRQGFYPLLLPGKALRGLSDPYNPLSDL